MRATLDSLVDAEPWAVVARDGRGQLSASVVFVDDPHGVTQLLGTDTVQRGAVLALEPIIAAGLGRAVMAAATERRLKALHLGPLIPGQIVASFAAGLGGASTSVAPIPIIERNGAGDVESYLSHGANRTLRKARNRLHRDDLDATVAFTDDPRLIASALPALERCHRERDHSHGRVAQLDDEARRYTWNLRMRSMAAAGQLELATMQLNDATVAFTLGSRDGVTYRLLEGRFVTQWARYAPGRLLEAAVVQRMLDDAELTIFDWMTAIASESLLGSNAWQPAVVLHAELN